MVITQKITSLAFEIHDGKTSVTSSESVGGRVGSATERKHAHVTVKRLNS